MSRRLVFRVHAIQRMAARGISVEDVQNVLAIGEIIREYPDDTPYPSRLILGWVDTRPSMSLQPIIPQITKPSLSRSINQTRIYGNQISGGKNHEMPDL